jgi:hypothetical protein
MGGPLKNEQNPKITTSIVLSVNNEKNENESLSSEGSL